MIDLIGLSGRLVDWPLTGLSSGAARKQTGLENRNPTISETVLEIIRKHPSISCSLISEIGKLNNDSVSSLLSMMNRKGLVKRVEVNGCFRYFETKWLDRLRIKY